MSVNGIRGGRSREWRIDGSPRASLRPIGRNEMRALRKCILPAFVTAAALAFVVPGAAAQGISVTDEATGAGCPAVSPSDSSEHPLDSSVSGGCVIHTINTEGLIEIWAHIFGVESVDSRCTNEFMARVGANGEGYLTDVELDGPACDRRPCGNWAGTPEAWEFHLEEGPNGARMEMHLCVENLGDGRGRQTCHIFFPFREELSTSHRYEIGSASAKDIVVEEVCEGFTGFRAELRAHWKTELTTVEFLHMI